jgi:hypothetical protein
MNSMEHGKQEQLREQNGQYAVGWDRLCKCGHRKGEHMAGDGRGAYECQYNVEYFEGHDECPCTKFKAARR